MMYCNIDFLFFQDNMTTTCSFSRLTVSEGCHRWKHYKGIPESGKTTCQERAPITSQEKTVIHVSYMQIKSLTIITRFFLLLIVH